MESDSTDLNHERFLLAAALQGDRTAFSDLVRPFLRTLRARVRRATSNLPVDPEEIVQETLVRSYTSLENYDPQYTFAQYFFGIARYATLRLARERRVETAVAWTEDGTYDGDETPLPSEKEIPFPFHALTGVSRFAAPDQRTRSRHRLLAVLSVLLAFGGYPHQQLAFGYGVMLWGKAKQPRRNRRTERQRADKVDITGDPDRVVSELGPRTLLDSGGGFRLELTGQERLDPESVQAAFAPFEYRLSLSGSELFANDASSRFLFADLAEVTIGQTSLEQYFGKSPQRSVAEWCRAVKERVRRHVLESYGASRSLLPMPPGAVDPITAILPANKDRD